VTSPSHVIFDLDGTLLDSSPGIVASFEAALDELGRAAPREQLYTLIGPPLRQSFATLGVDEPHLDDAVAIYRKYYAEFGVDDATIYDGIAETLDTLTGRGVRVAVATAKRVDFARRMLHDRGIGQYFDLIAGASLDLAITEKFDIMAEVLQHWRLAPSRDVWMVGDRDFDMAAAQRHGTLAVGALWGFGSVEELVRADADLLLDDPLELVGTRGADVPLPHHTPWCPLCRRVLNARHDEGTCPGAELGS
jgi:phosphoglycolate phosphatase